MIDKISSIVEVLTEVESDSTVPRNVKQKLGEIIGILSEPLEISIKIDKALQELEGVTEDNNLQPHVRMQIWNIVSLLEKTGGS